MTSTGLWQPIGATMTTCSGSKGKCIQANSRVSRVTLTCPSNVEYGVRYRYVSGEHQCYSTGDYCQATVLRRPSNEAVYRYCSNYSPSGEEYSPCHNRTDALTRYRTAYKRENGKYCIVGACCPTSIAKGQTYGQLREYVNNKTCESIVVREDTYSGCQSNNEDIYYDND